MIICSSPKLPYLQPRLVQSTCRLAAFTVSSLLAPRQRISPKACQQASFSQIQPVHSPRPILPPPFLNALLTVAQTSSISTPYQALVSQGFRLRGVNLPGSALVLSCPTPRQILQLNPSFKKLHLRWFALRPPIAFAMSTLSQPQTPAALDSPLREHRHRPVERLTDRLETPSLDDRSYRVIRLPNQLEVLLVHDADTDKASAAMDVNVGNFSDEAEMPGMAHAVESNSLWP